MKFIFCTCNVSMMEQVISLLENNGVTNYQVADKITARSNIGSPRFDTAVWPGYNVNITVQIKENDKAAEILDLLRIFNRESAFSDEERVTVCSFEMDNYFIN
jgi:hypothetical protein